MSASMKSQEPLEDHRDKNWRARHSMNSAPHESNSQSALFRRWLKHYQNPPANDPKHLSMYAFDRIEKETFEFRVEGVDFKLHPKSHTYGHQGKNHRYEHHSVSNTDIGARMVIVCYPSLVGLKEDRVKFDGKEFNITVNKDNTYTTYDYQSKTEITLPERLWLTRVVDEGSKMVRLGKEPEGPGGEVMERVQRRQKAASGSIKARSWRSEEPMSEGVCGKRKAEEIFSIGLHVGFWQKVEDLQARKGEVALMEWKAGFGSEREAAHDMVEMTG